MSALYGKVFELLSNGDSYKKFGDRIGTRKSVVHGVKKAFDDGNVQIDAKPSRRETIGKMLCGSGLLAEDRVFLSTLLFVHESLFLGDCKGSIDFFNLLPPESLERELKKLVLAPLRCWNSVYQAIGQTLYLFCESKRGGKAISKGVWVWSLYLSYRCLIKKDMDVEAQGAGEILSRKEFLDFMEEVAHRFLLNYASSLNYTLDPHGALGVIQKAENFGRIYSFRKKDLFYAKLHKAIASILILQNGGIIPMEEEILFSLSDELISFGRSEEAENLNWRGRCLSTGAALLSFLPGEPRSGELEALCKEGIHFTSSENDNLYCQLDLLRIYCNLGPEDNVFDQLYYIEETVRKVDGCGTIWTIIENLKKFLVQRGLRER